MAVCMCIIVVFAFAACGGNGTASKDMTPSETVSAFLDAFKAGDNDAINQVYAGEGDDFMSAYDEGEIDDGITQEIKDALMTKWRDFDYEVTGEEISEDGKTADVSLKITTYNMTNVFNNFYQEFMNQALEQYSGNSNNVSDADYEKMAMNILKEQIDKATEKDYTGEAKLSLTKTNDQWIVDQITEDNNDFLNAITGGLMDVLMDVVNSVSGDDGSDDADEGSDD